MADLITVAMLTNRLGPNVPVDNTQVESFITDATAQARKVAKGALDDVDHSTVEADYPDVVPVVVSAVRRMLINPDGYGSEMLDGYRSEQMPRDGVFLSKAEKREIRAAVDLLSATSVHLTADIPTPRSESVPEEEVGWVPL